MRTVKAWAIVDKFTDQLWDGGSTYAPIRLKRFKGPLNIGLKYVRVEIRAIRPNRKRVSRK